MTRAPNDCTTMAEVRAGVDAIDAALIDLLATRFGYMRAAARIKTERDSVRDEARKAQVIANVRAHAASHDIPEALIGALWDQLVEGSITYELARFDEHSREQAAHPHDGR